MPLRLVLCDARVEVLGVLRQEFAGNAQVSIEECSTREFWKLPSLDAAVLPALVAHESLGGELVPGKSEVLSTNGRPGPQWVVTSPPIPGRLVEANVGSHSQLFVEESVDAVDVPYWSYREILGAVSRFNSESEARIDTLGIDLQLLNVTAEQASSEVRAIQAALRDDDG